MASYSQDVNGNTLNAAQALILACPGIIDQPAPAAGIGGISFRLADKPPTQPGPRWAAPGFLGCLVYTGLYRQMEWAAIQLSSGYYRLARQNDYGLGVVRWFGSPDRPTINAGTAGVQNFFAPNWMIIPPGCGMSAQQDSMPPTISLFGKPVRPCHPAARAGHLVSAAPWPYRSLRENPGTSPAARTWPGWMGHPTARLILPHPVIPSVGMNQTRW